MPALKPESAPTDGGDSLTSLGGQPASGLLRLDQSHVVRACNAGFCAVHGGCETPEQIIGLPYHGVLVLLAKKVGIAGAQAIAGETRWPNDVYRRYRAGTEPPFLTRLADGRWVEIEQMAFDEDTMVIWRDRTASIQAMRCLSDAVQGAPEGLSLWDQSDRLMRSNDAFARIVTECGAKSEARMHVAALMDQLRQTAALNKQGEATLAEISKSWGAAPPRTHLLGLIDGRVLIAVRRPLASGGFIVSLRWAAEKRVDRTPEARAADQAIQWPIKRPHRPLPEMGAIEDGSGGIILSDTERRHH